MDREKVLSASSHPLLPAIVFHARMSLGQKVTSLSVNMMRPFAINEPQRTCPCKCICFFTNKISQVKWTAKKEESFSLPPSQSSPSTKECPPGKNQFDIDVSVNMMIRPFITGRNVKDRDLRGQHLAVHCKDNRRHLSNRRRNPAGS